MLRDLFLNVFLRGCSVTDKETIKRRKRRRELQGKIPKEIISVNIESLFYNYKEWHKPYVKYWRGNNGHLLRFVNSPMTLFVEDYVNYGEDIMNKLDEHIFIKWERDMFFTSNRKGHVEGRKRINEKKRSRSTKRLIKLIKSIKEHGYCSGEFDSEDCLINVASNYASPYGGKGYKVLRGNHRTAVCAGLGIKKIKVRCWHY
jgi:hypothetical protein